MTKDFLDYVKTRMPSSKKPILPIRESNVQRAVKMLCCTRNAEMNDLLDEWTTSSANRLDCV